MPDSQASYWLDERHLDYHRRQFTEPYRSTVFLGDLLRTRLGERFKGNVLDVACGAGACLAYLSKIFTGSSFTGVDIAEEAFQLGTALMREQGIANLPTFLAGDIYKLHQTIPPCTFELVLSIQTLSWVPEYEPLLESLLRTVKPGGLVVISSLFTDSLVDAKIELTQYSDDTLSSSTPHIYYNIYCLQRFSAECKRHGARSVEAIDFEIACDLPKPTHRQMGTYTELLANGRRLQLSGPLLMPWKFIVIKM